MSTHFKAIVTLDLECNDVQEFMERSKTLESALDMVCELSPFIDMVTETDGRKALTFTASRDNKVMIHLSDIEEAFNCDW